MSLRTTPIKLDELPSERYLANPLRAQTGARKTTLVGGHRIASRTLPTGGELLKRQGSAPKAPLPNSAAANGGAQNRLKGSSSEDEDDDGDDDDEDDESDEAGGEDRMTALRRRLQQTSGDGGGLGPFSVAAKTNRCTLTFVAGFNNILGSFSKQAASVTIRFSDIVRAADDIEVSNKLASYDPTRTVPISLRVLGTSLGEMERFCALEIYDASGKPLFSKFVTKHNTSDLVIQSGYPLFMFYKGGNNTVMLNPPALTQEHRSFWSFNLDTLEKNTTTYTVPGPNGESFKLVKKDSLCAKLMDYALSVKNKIISPRLLENDKFFSADDKTILKIPFELYTKVVQAYKKKLAQVQSSSFDLSSMKVVLKVLDLAKENNLVDIKTISGHIALQVDAHIPRRSVLNEDAENVKDYLKRTQVDKQDTSDEDSDDDI